MPSVCLYFQVHQPFRLAPHSTESGQDSAQIFDHVSNAAILRKVASKCYLPANKLLLELIKRYEGDLRVSFSLSGVVVEQMQRYSPETLDTFVALADSGCVEFLGETYHHSLASLYDEQEFREQVQRHGALMQSLFGRAPRVFRNTELIYDDRIGKIVHRFGFEGIIAEGADDILGWRSPNLLYAVPDVKLPLLVKNYRLSDDIAFRFSDRGWREYPLTAEKFAAWVHGIDGVGELCNLFMDYETFGEHQWKESGIFEFLKALPDAILQKPGWRFDTPSEVVARHQPVAELSFSRLTSWADSERDLTAWRGNTMQRRALADAFTLGNAVKATRNPLLLESWRKILTSDHFYYMCTKWYADGDVHAYFSPFESPYDAFIEYMAALRKLAARLDCANLERRLSRPLSYLAGDVCSG